MSKASFFFACRCSIVPTQLVKDCHLPTKLLSHLCKNHLTILTWASFWTLFHWPICLPSSDTTNLITVANQVLGLKVGVISLTLVFLFKTGLAILVLWSSQKNQVQELGDFYKHFLTSEIENLECHPLVFLHETGTMALRGTKIFTSPFIYSSNK